MDNPGDESSGFRGALETETYRGERSRNPFKNLRTFSSFKIFYFRLYYLGMLGHMVSMNMQLMARSLLVYRMTDSAAILGTLALFNAIPMLVLSLYGGVIADRVDNKIVLLIGQAGSALVSLTVALSLTFGLISTDKPDSWWILAVTSVCQGTIMGLMMPSRQAMMPKLVSGEQLMNAISLNNMGMNTLRLLAPAFSGFLIEYVGFEAVYYVNTGCYITAVIFISFLPRTGTVASRGVGALTQIKQGFRYLGRDTTILIILLITLVSVVLSHPFMMLMPVFTETILKVDASKLGLLMSVSGAGAIVGSLILASLPNRRRGLLMLSGIIVMGTALVVFAFSESWYLSLGVIAFIGLGQSGMAAMSHTLIQYYVDDEYRGRVMSIMMMQFGFTSFSTFLAGVLIEGIGAQWAIGGLAIILLVLAVLSMLFISRIRKLE